MRIRAIAIRIVRQFWHDKRSLALMILAPLFILWLLSLVFKGDAYEPKIGAIQVPEPFVQALESKGAIVYPYDSSQAEQELEAYAIDAILELKPNSLHVTLEGSDPSVSKSVLLLLQQTFEELNQHQLQDSKMEVSYLYGSEEMAAFDNFGPVLIGFFAFFFVFILSGISFLRERTGGTLERLLASPIKKYEIVIGYVLGFGIFTVLQSTLIAWFATQILDILMVGSIWHLLIITNLLAMTALTLGTLISTFVDNEFQMIQFIPIVVVPQIFFSGLFNLETMSEFLRGIGAATPLYYAAEAMRDIMIRGKGWDVLWPNALALIGFSLLFMALHLLALRKLRKI